MATIRRGDTAKQIVVQTLKDAFAEDFIGVVDKKIYVQALDNDAGEKVQIAISLAIPKNPIENSSSKEEEKISTNTTEEINKDTLEDLKKKLGIL